MIHHNELGKSAISRNRKLVLLINKDLILLGGNRKLKIYGTLKCASGKRMKLENRVFFKSAHEAINLGYRPCGNCLKSNYLKWKTQNNTQ
jgi:methylphosphotriester-DNA--protein-cysteine methyltransferase